MPLQTNNKFGDMFDTLNDTVSIMSVDTKIFAKLFDSLMVQSIGFDTIFFQYRKELGTGNYRDGVDGERRSWMGSGELQLIYIWIECTTKIDVE